MKTHLCQRLTYGRPCGKAAVAFFWRGGPPSPRRAACAEHLKQLQEAKRKGDRIRIRLLTEEELAA